ncbi:hypothetical protein MSAN_02099100 [Mycena sanguinolenta]|uniref:Fungal-type protein kinase domain-containing protein n=1 Tax=Mycena sanguinolenta TaxID=230812 RepID=A0A8H7CMG8_9AGAR|nr:hypothetical protein MSAN_02099100 [Mycena sanguinolenta]
MTTPMHQTPRPSTNLNSELEALLKTTRLCQAPRSITELTTTMELGRAFHDIFKSYRALYEKAGIRGDIRLYNLRYWRRDGSTRGALLDLDDLDEKPRPFPMSAREQRPYMAYMALELLDRIDAGRPLPVHHDIYRIDLESLFYIVLAVSCHYCNGKQIKTEEWPFLRTADLRMEKSNFLFRGVIPAPTPNFPGFKGLNQSLRALFREGFIAQADAREEGPGMSNFDRKTLGGVVTFDTFEAILDRHLALWTGVPLSDNSRQEHLEP